MESSLKIKNREKTPRKSKAKEVQDVPEARNYEKDDEEDASSSMYQKSPSQEGGHFRKGSPNKSFSFQGTPNKEPEEGRSPHKPSPLKSPLVSPIKTGGTKQDKFEQLANLNDLSVVNNIFLTNLSPPSQKSGHSVSVLSGKKAPKKYSPQKYREENQPQGLDMSTELSPKRGKKQDSPSKKDKSGSKSDKNDMLLEVMGNKGGSNSKKEEKSPTKGSAADSPTKKRLQFSEEKQKSQSRFEIDEEKPISPRKQKENGHSPSKSPTKNSKEKQKRSPKQKGKPEASENEMQNGEGQEEEEGINLLELINLSLGQQHAVLRGLAGGDDLEADDLLGELDIVDLANYPAYMLFQDEDERRQYFEELNSRYFEDIEEGQLTPKKKGVEYKKVVFGKRNKIKSSIPVTQNSSRRTGPTRS
jgi:hypothetical protein